MFKSMFKKTDNVNNELLNLILSSGFTQKKANELLSNGAKIDWLSEGDENFLHFAAQNANIEAIKWLCSKKININQIASDKRTPIFYAVESDSLESLKILIENGADINQKNVFNRTVLQEAVISNKNRIIDYLLEQDIDIANVDSQGRNIVFDSVANGTKNLVEKISSIENIDVNLKDANGSTVMHQKSVHDNPELALTLMDNGADPTICDEEGKNFLFYSATGGIENEELIDKAIDLGCDINSRNKNNDSILMETLKAFLGVSDVERRNSILKMAQKLIDNGVDIDAQNNQGNSAIFDVVKTGDLDALNFLLNQEGGNINIQDAEGNTPLVIAALEGNKNHEIILLLLMCKADPNIPDFKNMTIVEKLIDIILHLHNDKELEEIYHTEIDQDGEYFFILKEILSNSKVKLTNVNSKSNPLFFDVVLYHNKNLLSLLRQHGADINQTDKDGENIAFRFIEEVEKVENEKKKKEMIGSLQNLINSGMDINTKNKDGKSAVHQAVLKGSENTARVFIESKADMKVADNKGRNVVHCCVWHGKVEHFKMIYQKDQTALNETDAFGLLPIHYAAFMGYGELVIKMIKAESFINPASEVSEKMIDHLKKLAPNLDNLEEFAEDENDRSNVRLLVDIMKKEFNL